MSERRYHMKVFGQVQGVGYRYFCSNGADSLDIAGWVKNRGDGTVELEIQGSEKNLNRFISMVKKGPAFSRVEHVDKTLIPTKLGESTFEIRY